MHIKEPIFSLIIIRSIPNELVPEYIGSSKSNTEYTKFSQQIQKGPPPSQPLIEEISKAECISQAYMSSPETMPSHFNCMIEIDCQHYQD